MTVKMCLSHRKFERLKFRNFRETQKLEIHSVRAILVGITEVRLYVILTGEFVFGIFNIILKTILSINVKNFEISAIMCYISRCILLISLTLY